MTVQELINELKYLPPDAQVYTNDNKPVRQAWLRKLDLQPAVFLLQARMGILK